jgi:hypothetical protein
MLVFVVFETEILTGTETLEFETLLTMIGTLTTCEFVLF